MTNRASVHDLIRSTDADVVLNATGYTDVDGAEFEAAEAMCVNRDGVANLAHACRERGIPLVHYSSDYIFDGNTPQPIDVDDDPAPLSVYGASKLAGEAAIRDGISDHLIVRTSWLFAPHGKNFVRSILKLATARSMLSVVDDQVGRPTSCRDLANATLDLLAAEASGTFHVANDGSCSWYEFAGEIVQQANLRCAITPCSTADHPRPATRPPNSVLDLSRTNACIGHTRHWRDAVTECLLQIRTESTPHL